MVVHCDVGNWFYILLGIAWVAYSIYKGTSKNKKEGQKTESTEKKALFLDSFLGDFDQDTVPQPESEEIPNRAKTVQNLDLFEEESDKATVKSSDSVEELPVQEGISVTVPSPASSFFDQEAVKKRKKKRVVDLRKAVIYSEILNRPYK